MAQRQSIAFQLRHRSSAMSVAASTASNAAKKKGKKTRKALHIAAPKMVSDDRTAAMRATRMNGGLTIVFVCAFDARDRNRGARRGR